MSGPLSGIKVLEFQGMGPGPFAGMLLADMGASVLRVDRPGVDRGTDSAAMSRGKEHIALNLKDPEDAVRVRGFIAQSDALLDCYRPGVMERLGLGPDECLALQPQLVYARMTGWGQTGPLAHLAGHDMNYLAVAGVLNSIGRKGQPPTPPLNLVADFGGGGMLGAFGIVCGVLNARACGRGDVIDAAMIDGSALLMTAIFEQMELGRWWPERGTNMLDSGAPFYECYETSDGRYLAVAATEPATFARFLQRIGLEAPAESGHPPPQAWPALKAAIAERIAGRSRDEWVEFLANDDVSVSPVLTVEEAYQHPHNVLRSAHLRLDGIRQPSPAPRFARAAADEPVSAKPHDPVLSPWRE